MKPKIDPIIQKITDYVLHKKIESNEAFLIAHYDLFDSIGCGIMALEYPACTKLLGPIVPGADLVNGARVPGTSYELDPVRAAFNIGAIIRWLDFNDTWLAAEWGHPSDNLGGILAVADYLSRSDGRNMNMKEVLTYAIKAHEIQGILALENSFNRVGLDHVILVKVATTAVVTKMLGGTEEQILNAVSNAWIDGHSLRTYRHSPNTGSRKSWAAGDATSRGVHLSFMAMQGEMGYATALSAEGWGFNDVLFKGESLKLPQELGTYVMENILFKISFPAEFHAQTAVECAIKLHKKYKDQLEDIEKIVINTHESAIRIIDKKGELNNPADRDHCLQYMVAIGLIKGELKADHYEDKFATLPQIDELRDLMEVNEEKSYSTDYLNPDKRSIANDIQLFFKDGSSSEKIVMHYPIGHRERREEGIPELIKKYHKSLNSRFGGNQLIKIKELILNPDAVAKMNINEFMECFFLK